MRPSLVELLRSVIGCLRHFFDIQEDGVQTKKRIRTASLSMEGMFMSVKDT